MKEFAQEFALNLQPMDIICLHGDLGTGKTFFVREVVKALGSHDMVSSPTFVIVHMYTTPHKKIHQVYHIDAYRISHENISDIGMEEFFQQTDAITFIEWPEHTKQILPKKCKNIYFKEGRNIHERVILMD